MVPIGGGRMTTRATRFRNPIALTIDPATGHLWAAGAGQDALPYGHPYEFADDVSAHEGVADYGWPACEENRKLYNALHVDPAPSCERVVTPLVEFPAYATHIGLVFYPRTQAGAYAFPERYRGGLFVASHGSWHCCPSTAPRVAFVPMQGDLPAKPVDWNDPSVQWEPFAIDALATANSTRWSVRFTGIAVGPQGSLFVADDLHGTIYRIRPR
jgi:glucose/arabinose dehydrogenase